MQWWHRPALFRPCKIDLLPRIGIHQIALMQDDCVIPLKQNASEQQSAAANHAAVREFARKYAEQIGVRPSRLSTGLVQRNVATECSIKLRKVGYKRDEIHVYLKPIDSSCGSPMSRANPKLEALNKFNRVALRESPVESATVTISKRNGVASTMPLILPPSHPLGDPNTGVELVYTIASARQEKDLVATRYADVDTCSGLLSVEDTQSNMENVKRQFTLKMRQQAPASFARAEINQDTIARLERRNMCGLPKTKKGRQAQLQIAVVPPPHVGHRSAPVPAVVIRHRKSVRRLSLGARCSQMLVGKTLRPTELDDEVYALSSATSALHTMENIGKTASGEHNSHRSNTRLPWMEAMGHVQQLGVHWVAEIMEEISKPPKYTAEAVLSILEKFELGLQRWYDGEGESQCGLSREELCSACEMLASDTFMCLIYSTLLYFFDEHIATSRYFSVKLIPRSNFTAWVASRAAQLDFAWSSISKDAPHVFEWSSRQYIQQRQEARFHMIQHTFKNLKDALAKSPQTGISFSIPALVMALRFTVNRATVHMYPRWLQTTEGASAIKELDQTVTGWLDPHGYFSSLPVIQDDTISKERGRALPLTRKARMHFNDVSPHVAAVVGSPQSHGARRVMYQRHKCGLLGNGVRVTGAVRLLAHSSLGIAVGSPVPSQDSSMSKAAVIACGQSFPKYICHKILA